MARKQRQETPVQYGWMSTRQSPNYWKRWHQGEQAYARRLKRMARRASLRITWLWQAEQPQDGFRDRDRQ